MSKRRVPDRKEVQEFPVLLTLSEVALALRVSQRTVKRWISSRDLEAIRLPRGTVRVARTEVLKILGEAP